MQRLWGKSEAMQLLRRYIGSVEKGLTVSVDDRSIIRRHIVDLAVLAATTRCSIGESSASAVVATRTRRRPRPHRFALFGPRTQPSQSGAEPEYLATLSATAARVIGDILHGTRHRATAETCVHAPYSTGYDRCPYLRHRIAGWLFRYFALQPAFPFPLWRYAKRRPRTCPYGQHAGPYSLKVRIARHRAEIDDGRGAKGSTGRRAPRPPRTHSEGGNNAFHGRN